MYFNTARKCAILGGCCEGIPCQIDYLIDEALDTKKGTNNIISLQHHLLAKHGLGEVHLTLHACNCAGQHNAVVQYVAWHVLTGFRQFVTIPFMIVGHTRFSPDLCFGVIYMLKNVRKYVAYRCMVIECCQYVS